jgi:predicted dinucleotide-binding enzyme
MRIAILGTGTVGRTLAGRLAGLGHEVSVGTRDVEGTRARAEWTYAAPQLASFADATADAEVVVNASGGTVTMDVLAAAGEDHLAGKILVDVSNPLDFSAGFPPTMFVKDTDSLAEQIQAAYPLTRVVKTFNTMSADIMVDPLSLAGGDHTIFVAGGDAHAKTTVTGLLREFGWTDVLDLGDLQAARGLEMWLPLWLRLYGTLGTGSFNIKVVR